MCVCVFVSMCVCVSVFAVASDREILTFNEKFLILNLLDTRHCRRDCSQLLHTYLHTYICMYILTYRGAMKKC